MPIFTPHQDAALTAASTWLKATRGRASIFRLFGYAGTGKTTLAKHLAERGSSSSTNARWSMPSLRAT
jgi:exodeoxyribonuclease-5